VRYSAWKSGGTIVDLFTFTYDAKGNLLTQQDYFNLADGRGDWGQQSHYNALGYMTWFKRGHLFNGQVTNPSGASGEWTLDPWGNRLGPDGNIPEPTASGYAGSYSGGYHGNQQLTYDAWGRLVHVYADGDALGSLNVVFQYDALGRLVRKAKAGSTLEVSTFVNDLSGRALSETVSGNLDREYSYVWGMNGLVQRHRHEVGGVSAEDVYYLTDGRGDIRATTRASGQIHERFDLDPFGRLLLVETSTGGTRAYSLTGSHFAGGQYYDAFTGLYIANGTAYNPTLNRVMQANLAAAGEGVDWWQTFFSEFRGEVAGRSMGLLQTAGGLFEMGIGVLTLKTGIGVIPLLHVPTTRGQGCRHSPPASLRK
jgi:hypothetical protein